MSTILRPCAVALLLSIVGGAVAAEPLPLAEAERRALDYDAGIRASQAEAQVAGSTGLPPMVWSAANGFCSSERFLRTVTGRPLLTATSLRPKMGL